MERVQEWNFRFGNKEGLLLKKDESFNEKYKKCTEEIEELLDKKEKLNKKFTYHRLRETGLKILKER